MGMLPSRIGTDGASSTNGLLVEDEKIGGDATEFAVVLEEPHPKAILG